MLPLLELHREGKAGFSVCLGKGKLLNESHYVPPIKEVWMVSFAFIINSIACVLCKYGWDL